MENTAPLKVLLVAEGSGGHFIPALQVAKQLMGRGVQVQLWYAKRHHLESLTTQLLACVKGMPGAMEPVPIDVRRGVMGRLWQCTQLWARSRQCFETFRPDVVVGFGGWLSAPIVCAARSRRIGVILHEQNVLPGRANRWLARWVNEVAVSFPTTPHYLRQRGTVLTGVPIREQIGQRTRAEGAARFQLDGARPTLLILGGSQGARAINRVMGQLVGELSPAERSQWQVVHVTGLSDVRMVEQAYAQGGMTARVLPFLAEMECAYAAADLIISRAGASTIAEVARVGKPLLLIPYPHAGGHQRLNAQLVQSVGGGVVIEEGEATPQRLLNDVRRLLADERLRTMMGVQMRQLDIPDAAERLTETILRMRPSIPRHLTTIAHS